MTNVPTQLSDEARDALATARAHREAGELDEADAALAEAETHAPRSPEVAVELGLLRTAQVRYKDAVAAFDAALAAGADGDVVDLKREALQLLAIELFQAEDYLGAETAWDEVLAIAPEAMIAAYGKLMAIVADDRIADAVEFAGEVELRWPADAPLNLTSGEVLVTAGRPADALPFFDRALAADPTLEQAATRKLDLLRQLDRADEAAAFAAGLQPELDESVPVLLSRGWVEVARSRFADAVALFDRALDLDAENVIAFRGKLISLRADGELAAARELESQLPASVEDDPVLLRERAWLAGDEERWDDALSCFDRALEEDPEDESALRGKLWVLRRAKRFDDARGFEASLAPAAAADAAMLAERGWLAYDESRYDDAATLFEESIEQDPDRPSPHRGRLSSLRLGGRFDEAAAFAAALPDAVRDDPAIVTELGWLAYDRKQFDDALPLFERAMALDPTSDFAAQGWVSTLRLLEGRLDDAVAAAEVSLERWPASDWIVAELGWALQEQGKPDKALAAFDRALELNPQYEFAIAGKVAALRASGRLQEAYETAGAVSPIAARSARAWATLAGAAKDVGKLDEAEQAWAKAIDESPQWAFAYVERADVLSRLGRGAEARELVALARDRFAGELPVHDQLFWYFVRRHDLQAAQRELEVLTREAPDTGMTLTARAGLHYSRGEYVEAEADFRQVIERPAGSPTAVELANLTWAVLQQDTDEKVDEAEELARSALALDPRSLAAWAALGAVAMRRGRLRDAEDYLRRTLELHDREGYHGDLGGLLVRMGRHDEAERELRLAIEYDTYDAQAHVELGNLYLEQRKTSRAINEFRYAMAIDPHSEDPPRALAIALAKTDRRAAETILRNALRMLDKAKLWRIHLALAWLLECAGDETQDEEYYESALKEAREAIRDHPSDPVGHFQAGVLRMKLRDYAGAVNHLEACLKRDPNHYEADRACEQARELRRKQRIQTQVSVKTGILVGVVALVQLVVIWVAYLFDQVSEKLLAASIPVMLGLFLVSFLMPWLNRLKLPGLEAEVSGGRSQPVSSGPSGSVTFQPATPTITTRPR